MGWTRSRWLAWAAVSRVFSYALSACTPIQPVSEQAREQRPPDTDTDTTDEETSQTTNPADRLEQNAVSTPCDQGDSRSCEPGNPSRRPLLCMDGMWRSQSACAENEHCDSMEGSPSQGRCVKIPSECIGRLPDAPFCDKENVRVCSDARSRVMQTCGEDQRCVERDGGGECTCNSGAVLVNGSCEVATTCDMGGGCDPLTVCSMNGAMRVCSSCPEGFGGGDGSRGCTPLLLDVQVQPGVLSPELSDRNQSYRVALPLVRPTLSLTAAAAQGVSIDVNGAPLAAGQWWTSDVIRLGSEHTIALNLTGTNDQSTRYELSVTRHGLPEGSVQPKNADDSDTFGYNVAINGDTMLVGAPSEDGVIGGVNPDGSTNSAFDAGAAYVFVRVDGRWQQQAYLKMDQPQVGSFFGGGVAVDGDMVLVGGTRATDHRVDSSAAPKLPGIAYVFERQGTVWTRTHILQSGSSDLDWFGLDFAISKDFIFITAPHDSEAGQNAGAVYVLARDGNWGPLQKILPPEPKPNGGFGWSLSATNDAVLIGEPQVSFEGQGPGTAFAFKRNGAVWQPDGKLVPNTPSTGAAFGFSVALAGDYAAVGAPRPGYPHGQQTEKTPSGEVYIFQHLSDGTWMQTKTLQALVPRESDWFGISLALSDRTLVVGASGDRSSGTGIDADPERGDIEVAGALYIFAQQGENWALANYIKGPVAKANALFADRIAMSGDTIVVGAMHDDGSDTSQSGRVYVFR